MSEPMSRRSALKTLVTLAAGAGCLADQSRARADGLPHLTLTDPTAVALGYHESAKQVDPKLFPNYVPSSSCSNCLQLKGEAGQAWRPCNLFPGKLVNANGWCRVWVKRP